MAKKYRAVYYGVNDRAVKVWDSEQGVIEPELLQKAAAENKRTPADLIQMFENLDRRSTDEPG